MKNNKLIDWFPLILLCWLMTCQTITARWFTYVVPVSELVQKIVTILTYLPFFLLALCKVLTDVKTRRLTVFNGLYYGFCAYYLILTVCRFFLHMQVKENMYYTIILLGSMAYLSLLIQGKCPLRAEKLSRNLCIFALVLLGYRLIYCLFLEPILQHSPVNEIAIGGMALVLVPAAAFLLRTKDLSKVWKIVAMTDIFGIALLVMTLSARSIFSIVLCEIGVVFLLSVRNRHQALRILISVVLAAVVMAVLLFADVPGVRYAFYRETGISLMGQNESPEEITAPSDEQDAAAQIERSDAMRGALNKFSIAEFKKNPLFGTGELMFRYTASGYEFNVPAHNFVLATLNCYGIVGLLLILAMLCAALWQMKMFDFRNREKTQVRLFLLLMVGCYFALGMVQATVYDIMVLPTMVTSMAAMGQYMISRGEDTHVDS